MKLAEAPEDASLGGRFPVSSPSLLARRHLYATRDMTSWRTASDRSHARSNISDAGCSKILAKYVQAARPVLRGSRVRLTASASMTFATKTSRSEPNLRRSAARSCRLRVTSRARCSLTTPTFAWTRSETLDALTMRRDKDTDLGRTLTGYHKQ